MQSLEASIKGLIEGMKATDKKVDDAKKDAAKAKQEGDATASKVKA